MGACPVYAGSPSPSQRPAPTRIASRSPFPLGLCSYSTSLSKMGTQAAPRDRRAQEEMGTEPRHALSFESLYSFKSLFLQILDDCLAHFAEFRCPFCQKKIGKMSHAFGKVGFGKKAKYTCRKPVCRKVRSSLLNFFLQTGFYKIVFNKLVRSSL